MLRTLTHRLKAKSFKVGIISLLSVVCANAVEIEVKDTNRNWIWFGDKPNPGSQKIEAIDGKVTLAGTIAQHNHYNPTSTFIDKITVDGSTSLANIQTNQSFTIGTLTLKGETSLAVAGSYVPNNCPEDALCAVFNVQNLILDSTTGKDINLRRVNAANTTITGEGNINIADKGTGTAENNSFLGNVLIKENAKATIKSNTTATASANSVKVEKGAKLTFGADTQGEIKINTLEVAGELDTQNVTDNKLEVNTLNVKKDATLTAAANKFTLNNVIAEAGATGLDKVLTDKTSLTITANKSGSIAEFFDKTPISTNLGTSYDEKKIGTTTTHNVVDTGLVKYSGDYVTIVAKDAQGSFIANSQMTNFTATTGNAFQASLDNAYLAHNILLANTMAIANKMFLFKNFKSSDEMFQNAEALNKEGYVVKNVDFWLDYEYDGLKNYGSALNVKNNSVQMGVGFLQTNAIKAGAFFRYTNIDATNENINNSYSGSSSNAGFYATANLWTNGYLRGQFAFTAIDIKGEYTLRNDMTGINTSGSANDKFKYLTTGFGIAQEGVIGNVLWGSVAFDVNHIVPLSEEYEFEKDSESDNSFLSSNSMTFATISAMFGTKLNADLMIYARTQFGFALSQKDDEIYLEDDEYNKGSTQPAAYPYSVMIEDYAYNYFLGNVGVGGAYNFTKNFKMSADVGAGFYSEAKTSLNLRVGFNYLF